MSLKDRLQGHFESHPRLYKLLARGYFMKDQFFYGLKNPGLINKRVYLHESVELIDHFQEGEKNYFFGYYDKSPWNFSEEYLLYLSAPRIERHPTVEDEATIGYIDLSEGERYEVAKTRAWNWQQGCMLQWLDNGEEEPLIIYNDHRSGRFVSVVHHLEEGEQEVIPFPVYDVDWESRKLLTLNFERLHHLRPGYGYDSGKEGLDGRSPSVEGIYAVDLENGGVKLLVSLSELAEDLDEQADYHWVNHIKFNPSGNRVVFFHRYLSGGERKTRMLTIDPDGSDLYCLVEGSASHFAWKDDDEILAYAKAFSDEPKGYYLFEDKSKRVEKIGGDVLCQDGHPSFSSDGRWLLTDTYPDKGGRKHLILYDMEERERHDLGKFYTPVKYRLDPLKSDLHPRWDRKGEKICFDSVHEGRRKIYVMDLRDLLGQ